MMKTSLTPTIFHADWWLNAATNGNYEVAEVVNAGTIVGRLPYWLTRRFGMNWCAQPELTQFLGPAVDEGTGNIHTRFKRRLEITRDLLHKLPPASLITFKCHRGVGDVLAFQEQGFQTGVQFTHEIRPTTAGELWPNVYRQKRVAILRAMDQMVFSTLDDPSAFLQFYQANLDMRGLKCTMDLPACRRIIEACLARDRGRIFVALDRCKNLAAAIFCVWDESVSYYTMTTRNRSSHRGTVSALIWQAIQDAASRRLIFDHGGLNISSAISFHAEFGGNLSPRYVVTKTSLPVGIARLMRVSAAWTGLFSHRGRLWW